MVATKIPQTHILPGIVVGVILVVALLTCEDFTLTVVRVRKPKVGTPTRRILRGYLFHIDTVLCCPVFDVFVETIERPPVAPRRSRSLTNVD